MPQGTVRWFDPERGFGFLAPEDGSPDLFVHVSEILTEENGPRILREGQGVDFEVGEGERGPQAREVRVTDQVAAGTELGVLGTCSWYEPGKGYGFVQADGGGGDVFVHSSAVVTGGVLAAGMRVAFLVVPGEKGPQAQHVLPLAADAAPAAAAAAPAATPADGADGTVAWFDTGKGFGFVTPDRGGEDVFVHVRALTGGLTELTEGQRIAFGTTRGDRGMQAKDVRVVGGGARPATTARPSQGRGDANAKPGEGTVARFDPERGFGFITPDDGSTDLFVHVSVVRGTVELEQGDRVRFGVRQSDRGVQADRVELL